MRFQLSLTLLAAAAAASAVSSHTHQVVSGPQARDSQYPRGSRNPAWIQNPVPRRAIPLKLGALVAGSAAVLFKTVSLHPGVAPSTKRLRGGAQSARMAVVDTAVHVWEANPKFPFAEGVTPPASDAKPEDLLKMMDANGVDKTVIVQPICYKFDNSYVAECIRKWPERFAAVSRVDPTSEASVEQLDKLKEDGFIGVRFGPVEQAWWEADVMLKILQKSADIGFPVLLFLGKDGGQKLGWIAPVLEKVPMLKVVIDHMADVDPSDAEQMKALCDLARLPNVNVKISHTWALSREDYPWKDSQGLAEEVVKAYGIERVMFASDWPVCQMPSWPGGNTDYATTVKLAKEEYSFLSEGDRQKLLGGNAMKIWFST